MYKISLICEVYYFFNPGTRRVNELHNELLHHHGFVKKILIQTGRNYCIKAQGSEPEMNDILLYPVVE